MDDNATHDYDSAQIAESYSPAMAQTGFTYSVEVSGVGGWLLLFVIGQLALRPMLFLTSLFRGATAADIAERFPATATLIRIETAIQFVLLIGGILVGCALLKTGVRWPVLLTKAYLVANALLTLTLAVLYFGSDLPEDARAGLMVRGIATGIIVSIVSFIWFMYFTKSKRVQATYLERH
jgi:hypothetical protein